jgi:hypothetical protein
MAIELPKDAEVGRIIVVNYPQSDPPNARAYSGPYEGRIVAIKGPKLTVTFVYKEYALLEETIVLNLATGMDEEYNVPIGPIRLVERRRTAFKQT